MKFLSNCSLMKLQFDDLHSFLLSPTINNQKRVLDDFKFYCWSLWQVSTLTAKDSFFPRKYAYRGNSEHPQSLSSSPVLFSVVKPTGEYDVARTEIVEAAKKAVQFRISKLFCIWPPNKWLSACRQKSGRNNHSPGRQYPNATHIGYPLYALWTVVCLQVTAT